MPLVATAGQAKAMASARLARAWSRRERITIRLPITRAALVPGRIVEVAGERGRWLVERQSIERMAVELTLVAADERGEGPPADGGRATIPPDVVSLPSRLVLLDLPDGAMEGVAGPSLQMAVASPSNSWRPVPIDVAIGGTSNGSRSATREAIIGTTEGALADGVPGIVEPAASIVVSLANPGKWLVSADEAALELGANLAVVGDELLQYATAEPLGPGRFRLSGLRRGLRGSDEKATSHALDEPFVLLVAETLKILPFHPSQIGEEVTVTALGVGNAQEPPTVSRVVTA